MSESIADTPDLGVKWCPACSPERDPSREILDVRYCEAHSPGVRGAEDDAAKTSGLYLSGAGEAEAEVCRAVQALIRAVLLVACLGAALPACSTIPAPPAYFCAPAELHGVQGVACMPVTRRPQ